MTDEEKAAFLEALRTHVGKQGQPFSGRDPVNQPMIRHWCDAMEDHNPAYTDPAFAAHSVHGGIVAPPTMLLAWTMLGNIPRPFDRSNPQDQVLHDLDAAGFTSVVATNTDHDYLRYFRLGDEISGVQSLSDVSPEKHTALGVGHFVTTTTEYRDQRGAAVARAGFRILKFKPGTGRTAAGSEGGAPRAPRPLRPRPGVSHDTRFFWDGLKAGELRIQRCAGCGTLHHPPRVRCHRCGSYDMGYTVSSGKGVVYSFVEPCYPQVPAFDYPLVVGLVELEEGTRLLTNIVDLDPNKVAVGMPVELVLRNPDPELTLPMFRPARAPRRETTLRFDEIAAGDELPPCPIPITAKLIVAGAIASRDYQDVHHDREMAIARGSADIFMNILTTGGLCGRYISDWAGPDALIRSLKIRLGTPNYPHDTMTMSGSVLSKKTENGANLIEVGIRGYNHSGDHVTGSMTLALPGTVGLGR
ncbi:MAG: MaoC family dehydratase N-terminal domain-containing protein [Candidatus Binatia bacterium]